MLKQETIKVLGFDPGIANTGIGVIESLNQKIIGYHFGVITTKASTPEEIRLKNIYEKSFQIIKDTNPNFIVIEDAFSLGKNPRSGILLGEVIGTLMLAAASYNIPVIKIAVKEAKKILSNNGSATKEQLEKSVRNLLEHKEKIKPYHAADALALAIIGLYRMTNMRALHKRIF